MSEKVHGALKEYLLELGTNVKNSKGKPYYRVYSGDSEPIDIRLGKKHYEYLPDVVWERKGRPYIIEIALSEDWRSIVGEITLASLAKGCAGILVITTCVWKEKELDDLMSIVGGKLGVVWWRWIILDKKQSTNVEEAKTTVKGFLRDWDMI